MTIRPIDQILSMADLKRTSEHLGGHFFDADTMRFFNSRVGDKIYTVDDSHGYFVTSERFEDGPRHYTVRYYAVERVTRESDGREVDTLDIGTCEAFGRFSTRYEAHREARGMSELVRD